MDRRTDRPYFIGPFQTRSGLQQNGPGTSDQLLFRLQDKFKKIPLLVIYHLTKFDYIIKSGYSKNYICKLMLANSWHHKIIHFQLSFWIWKIWKGKNLQKFEYLKNKKSFLDEIKTFFIVFEGRGWYRLFLTYVNRFWALTWACSNLISSKTETIIKRHSSFLIKSAM